MRTTLFAALMLATFLGAVPRARTARAGEAGPKGTIAFSSLAPRGWDVFLIDVESRASRRLTDRARERARALGR